MRARTSGVLILIILLLGGVLIARHYLYLPRAREKKLASAVELVESGNDQEAIPLLRQLAGRPPFGPGERDAARRLARALARTGDRSSAAKIWAGLEEADDPGIREEALFNLAMIAAERGEQSPLDAFISAYPESAWLPAVRLARARVQLTAGNQAGAEEDYRRIVTAAGPEDIRADAREELGKINIGRLCSRTGGLPTVSYTVRSGDSLAAIARRHQTTPDLVRMMNRLPTDVIHPGQELRLPAESFSAVVSKSKNILTLFYGEEFFKQYPVGTGRDNSSPVGEFTIVTKLIDPPWITPGEVIPPLDERNILGTRWMGFNDPYATYGIHGTTRPETVGTQSSAGCVRLRNEDVEELFIFLPRGARVVIEE